MDYNFLALSEVLEIHTNQINLYGGDASIRDMSLLESAYSMPQASFGDTYLHDDVYEIAAAYLYHIVNNHPFVDGNKRTGAVSALMFLHLNGYILCVSQEMFADMVLSVAKSELSKKEVADFFREWTKNKD